MPEQSDGLTKNPPEELTLQPPVRGMRFELFVVLVVAVLPLVIYSVRIAMTQEAEDFVRADLQASAFSSVRESLAGLLLVAYVAYQRGDSLQHFGWRIRPFVIPASLAVFALAMVGYCVVCLVVHLTGLPNLELAKLPRNQAIPTGAAGLFLLRVVVSPLFEETVVRAYLMTRLRDLGFGPAWCVLGSTLVQTSYHIHAGLVLAPAFAAIFLVFSLYFVRFRNLPVIILAHFYIDIIWWSLR